MRAQDSAAGEEPPSEAESGIVGWPGDSSSADEGRAQVEDAPPERGPTTRPFSLGLELAFFSGNIHPPGTADPSGNSGGLHLLTAELRASYAINEKLLASFTWAGLYGSVKNNNAPANERFLSGNLYLEATHAVDAGYDSLSIWVGGGLALPLARIPDGDPVDSAAAAASYLGALGMRGTWGAWLYSPEQLVLVVPGRAELTVESFVFGFDFTPALYVPTTDRDDETDFILQAGADAVIRWEVLDFGVALHAVWGLSQAGDAFQLSTEPFVRLRTDSAFAQARFTVNIDGPSGPISFDTNKGRFWGVHAGGGVRF